MTTIFTKIHRVGTTGLVGEYDVRVEIERDPDVRDGFNFVSARFEEGDPDEAPGALTAHELRGLGQWLSGAGYTKAQRAILEDAGTNV